MTVNVPPPHLVVHGVDPLDSQQLCGLQDQVCSTTREHPEAQIQLELGWSRFCIQTLKGLETAFGPAGNHRWNIYSFSLSGISSPAEYQLLQTSYTVSEKSAASYFSCRGSQSSPGRSCLAVCLTSSLSTNKLQRCSACTTATRIHSMRGGRSRNGLDEGHGFIF